MPTPYWSLCVFGVLFFSFHSLCTVLPLSFTYIQEIIIHSSSNRILIYVILHIAVYSTRPKLDHMRLAPPALRMMGMSQCIDVNDNSPGDFSVSPRPNAGSLCAARHSQSGCRTECLGSSLKPCPERGMWMEAATTRHSWDEYSHATVHIIPALLLHWTPLAATDHTCVWEPVPSLRRNWVFNSERDAASYQNRGIEGSILGARQE